MVTENKVLQEIRCQKKVFTYLAPKNIDGSCYLAFLAASTGKLSSGRTGYTSGIYLPAGGRVLFEIVDWYSARQQRVSFSSNGAEVLAAATSADKGALMPEKKSML